MPDIDVRERARMAMLDKNFNAFRKFALAYMKSQHVAAADRVMANSVFKSMIHEFRDLNSSGTAKNISLYLTNIIAQLQHADSFANYWADNKQAAIAMLKQMGSIVTIDELDGIVRDIPQDIIDNVFAKLKSSYITRLFGELIRTVEFISVQLENMGYS